jgi:hypothetical protein
MEKKEKTGGRIKGVPNKTTAEIREQFQKLVSNNIELLENDIKALEPMQRIKTIIELSKFVLPTMRAIEVTENENNKTEFKGFNFLPKKEQVIINIPPDVH